MCVYSAAGPEAIDLIDSATIDIAAGASIEAEPPGAQPAHPAAQAICCALFLLSAVRYDLSCVF